MGRSERHKNCLLLPCLEKDRATVEPSASREPTLGVIDLMMLLRMGCTDTAKCTTFGQLSDQLLGTFLGLKCEYIAVVGDNFTNEESNRQGNVQMQDIRNPTVPTPLPKQCLKMLSNANNKANLADFLLRD